MTTITVTNGVLELAWNFIKICRCSGNPLFCLVLIILGSHVVPVTSRNVLGSIFDPTRLHLLAEQWDNSNTLFWITTGRTTSQEQRLLYRLRGWSDSEDLGYGTGTTYLSGSSSTLASLANICVGDHSSHIPHRFSSILWR